LRDVGCIDSYDQFRESLGSTDSWGMRTACPFGASFKLLSTLPTLIRWDLIDKGRENAAFQHDRFVFHSYAVLYDREIERRKSFAKGLITIAGLNDGIPGM
jgi:hypothetical protein